MEEDEDVVIQGASLHQHLKDTGFTDYEVAESQNLNKQLEQKLSFVRYPTKDGYRSVFKSIWRAIMFVLQMKQTEADFLEISAIKIVQSRLLLEEDLLTLEHLSPTVKALAVNQEWLLDEKFAAKILEMYSLFPPTLNVLFSPFMWPALFVCLFAHYWIVGGNSLSRLTVLLLLSTILISLRLIVIQKMVSAYESFESIMKLLDRALKVLSRALKALNEAEILKRGMNGNGQNCPTNDYSATLTDSIHQIIESLSVAATSGHWFLKDDDSVVTRNNLSKIFDSRFTKSNSLVEFSVLPESTSRESFSKLKVKRKVVASQWSAFITELFMTLEMSVDFNRKSYIYIPSLVPSEELNRINSDIQLLERVLTLSHNSWYGDGIPALQESRSSKIKQFDIVDALQTLSFHTKCVITKVIELESELVIEESKPSAENSTMDVVEKHYSIIKNELESCCGCLEEVLDRTERLYKESVSNEVRDSGISEIDVSKVIATNGDMKIIGTEDRVIEDEFFELVMSDEKVADDVTTSDILLSRKEEKVEKKRYKKQCKKVLQEIQPILQKKRDECQKREEIALGKLKCNKSENFENDDSKLHMEVSSNLEDCLLSPEENYNEFTNELHRNAPLLNFGENCVKPNGYDSDEENLKLYKKIREDLINDEKMRNETDPERKSYDYKTKKKRKILDWSEPGDECDIDLIPKCDAQLHDVTLNIQNNNTSELKCDTPIIDENERLNTLSENGPEFDGLDSTKKFNSVCVDYESCNASSLQFNSKDICEIKSNDSFSDEEFVEEGKEDVAIDWSVNTSRQHKLNIESQFRNLPRFLADEECSFNVFGFDAVSKGREMGMKVDEDVYGGFGEGEIDDEEEETDEEG